MSLLILNLYMETACIQTSILYYSLDNCVLTSWVCMPSSVLQSLFVFCNDFEGVDMTLPFIPANTITPQDLNLVTIYVAFLKFYH